MESLESRGLLIDSPSLYGEDQVDRVETGSLSIFDLPEGSGNLRDLIKQDTSSRRIPVAHPIDLSPESVKNEASKINWWIAASLLILGIIPGLIYIFCFTGQNEKTQSIESHEVRSSVQQVKESGSTFEPYEEPFRSSLYASERDIRRFQDNKEALKAEAQSLIRIKMPLQEERAGLEEQIPIVKAMGFIERKRKGLRSSKELQARKDQITKEIESYDCRAKEIANELRLNYLQHPQFREVGYSHKGFPFRIYFGAEELRQGYSYDRYNLPRNSFEFHINMNKKLMYWSGAEDIDPFGTSHAALAQGVLVQLARRPDEPLLVPSWKERRLQPRTVDRTLEVRFQRDRTGPIMLIQRQIETNEGKKYQWNETVRFNTGSPVIAREVIPK